MTESSSPVLPAMATASYTQTELKENLRAWIAQLNESEKRIPTISRLLDLSRPFLGGDDLC